MSVLSAVSNVLFLIRVFCVSQVPLLQPRNRFRCIKISKMIIRTPRQPSALVLSHMFAILKPMRDH